MIASIIIFIIGILWAIRELACWYWKITELSKNQKEQIRLLKKIAGEKEVEEKPDGKAKAIITVIAMCFLTIQGISVQAQTTVNASFCQGDSIQLPGGSWASLTGTYYDTLADILGNDSVIITTVTVNPVYASSQTASICFEDSIFLGGNYQTSAGIYTDTFPSVNSCDSIMVTSLFINSQDTTTTSATVCNGDSIFLGSAWQTLPGTYYDTYPSSYSCDSVMITTLSICVAIEDIRSSAFKIYPNPSAGIFNIKEKTAFDVFAPSGQMIYSNQDTSIDLSEHSDGIYTIRLRNESSVEVKKLILLRP